MGYEIDSNTYTTERRVKAYDIFARQEATIDEGTDIDSVWASWIIVDEADQVEFEDLTPAECLAKKVELGYISIKA